MIVRSRQGARSRNSAIRIPRDGQLAEIDDGVEGGTRTARQDASFRRLAGRVRLEEECRRQGRVDERNLNNSGESLREVSGRCESLAVLGADPTACNHVMSSSDCR